MKRYFAFIAIALLSLFLFGCDLFSPTKKTTMEVTVNHAIASENAVVSEELTSNIASISEEKKIIVLSTNAEALGIKEGKIIVVSVTDKTPNGLLKKVTNVSTQAGASTLSLEQASLTEALSEADIMISGNLEANGETYSSNKSISVRPNPRALKSNLNIEIPIEEYVLYDADGNSATTNDQIVLNGSLELGLSISMHIKISNGELKKFEFVSKPSITSKISISSSISLGSIDIKKNLIEPFHLKRIVFLVATPSGPFPIVIVPVLKLDATLSGSASIGVSSDVTTTLEQQAGAVYEDGHLAPVNNHTEQFDFSQPSLSANCKLDLSVGPSLDFLIYDVVGPYFEVKGKTSFVIDTGSSPCWTLSAGLYSKIGFNMEIFDVATLNYDLVLFDFSKVLASSAGKQFTITYNGNGNTSGSVPIDNNLYAEGESATVLGPANLEKTGCQFLCWNTKQDGSGTNYYAGDKIKFEKQNVTLYADWTITGSYLFATGYNWTGQFGDGTTIDKSTPVKVMENVQSVSAGGYHTMILKNDGSLWATGGNWYGQLGDGTTIYKLTPVKVMQNVQSVSAANWHTMILKNDGSLWATGFNDYGELGDGTIISKSTPVKVMENVQSVSAGGWHTMIIVY